MISYNKHKIALRQLNATFANIDRINEILATSHTNSKTVEAHLFDLVPNKEFPVRISVDTTLLIDMLLKQKQLIISQLNELGINYDDDA